MVPVTVEEYIAQAPQKIRGKLGQIRKAIINVAPKAVEKLSYGMPYYGYKGRLAYFAYTKTHIGLYLMPPLIENHKQELEKYKTAKATIRFPLDEPLPMPLIRKLLKAGVDQNEFRKK
jgi:uncharacterized protein YdhG (YjbR/CyaY superfamily)